MPAWAWISISAILALLVVDWLIVMGINPKRWKGKKTERGGRKQ